MRGQSEGAKQMGGGGSHLCTLNVIIRGSLCEEADIPIPYFVPFSIFNSPISYWNRLWNIF